MEFFFYYIDMQNDTLCIGVFVMIIQWSLIFKQIWQLSNKYVFLKKSFFLAKLFLQIILSSTSVSHKYDIKENYKRSCKEKTKEISWKKKTLKKQQKQLPFVRKEGSLMMMKKIVICTTAAATDVVVIVVEF